MSRGWFLSESPRAWAVPAKVVRMVAGSPRPAAAWLMASEAWESDTPGARLNEMVAEGNWP